MTEILYWDYIEIYWDYIEIIFFFLPPLLLIFHLEKIPHVSIIYLHIWFLHEDYSWLLWVHHILCRRRRPALREPLGADYVVFTVMRVLRMNMIPVLYVLLPSMLFPNKWTNFGITFVILFQRCPLWRSCSLFSICNGVTIRKKL